MGGGRLGTGGELVTRGSAKNGKIFSTKVISREIIIF